MARKKAPTSLPRRVQGVPTSIVFPPEMLEWLNQESIRMGVSRSVRVKMCIKREMDYELGKGVK